MDPTARFFAALKKTAVTLESESVKLRHAFDNRNNNDEDGDAEARALRAFHEVSCDVRDLKGQIQGQIAQQRAQDNELDRFIKVARVMEQRLAKDIQALKGHWEKYGYQAPQDTRRPTKTEDEAAAEMETESTNEGVNQEEDGGSRSSSSSPRPSPGPPSLADPLRTPQLSDFGLSEVEMKRALAGVEWCSEAPLMPELSLRHPSLSTPAPPPMPLTPKRALRMDDDELQAPQMSDFGLSEHTMCLNNDFTMDLLRKNVEKLQRPHLEMPVAPVSALTEARHTKVQNLVSPEPPVFLTPGFKVSRTDAPRSPPARSGNLPASPEVPVFETPYMNPMAASRKSARQPEPVDARADGGPPSPRSKRRWEYDVPDVSIAGAEDNPMPAMPNLESALGNSLQTRSTKLLKKSLARTESTEESAAQDFSPGTPRLRVDYQEPSTPEMPDLSSVTQDICKLLTQAQLKRPCTAVVNPTVRPKKDHVRAARLSEVSESEFQSLPRYLKQMTLPNLNQAVHHINKFTEDAAGGQTEFRMEDLRRICFTGTKTPVYILCLTELRRLEHAGGERSTSVYKLR
uniref:spindle and kinetochore-associated protein 3 isoform X2 n=1 Tax=Gasterosteus aculeatus aculeatus TaxID=481459 RepID=UPI001A987C1C|nr:spindle and kinetochore-associated protein 3 isoform X2 [Gasterosteus aculeatus aculeatus]